MRLRTRNELAARACKIMRQLSPDTRAFASWLVAGVVADNLGDWERCKWAAYRPTAAEAIAIVGEVLGRMSPDLSETAAAILEHVAANEFPEAKRLAAAARAQYEQELQGCGVSTW